MSRLLSVDFNARDQRLKELAGLGVRLETETGLPVRLLIAQWSVESDWGAQPVGHSNYFGMKKAARHTKSCITPTHELVNGKSEPRTLEFADYDSLEESARDYTWLITHGAPYAEAWSAYKAGGNFTALVRAVMAKYATAKYGDLAVQIASQDNVSQAIAEARAAA